jgi:hypothetical protein
LFQDLNNAEAAGTIEQPQTFSCGTGEEVLNGK